MEHPVAHYRYHQRPYNGIHCNCVFCFSVYIIPLFVTFLSQCFPLYSPRLPPYPLVFPYFIAIIYQRCRISIFFCVHLSYAEHVFVWHRFVKCKQFCPSPYLFHRVYVLLIIVPSYHTLTYTYAHSHTHTYVVVLSLFGNIAVIDLVV